jgi:guanine deaminase
LPAESFAPNPAFMRRAIAEARGHLEAMDGGPFGACLVRGDEVLAVAHNTVLKDLDPTCHAEITAIRLAARKLKSYDLSGCEIYSTTEPCPMCFAAIHWARIGRLIYGTAIIEVAQLGFNELTLGSRQMQELGRSPVAVYSGFLADECRQLLAAWARMPGRQVY